MLIEVLGNIVADGCICEVHSLEVAVTNGPRAGTIDWKSWVGFMPSSLVAEIDVTLNVGLNYVITLTMILYAHTAGMIDWWYSI